MTWEDDVRYRIFQARSNLHFVLLETGAGELNPWWDSAAVVHPHWKLYINETAGAEFIPERGAAVPLAPGYAWLIPPWTTYARRSTRVPHCWVEFDVIGISAASIDGLMSGPIGIPLDPRLAYGRDLLRRSIADRACDDFQILCEAEALIVAAFGGMLARLDAAQRQRLFITIGDGRLAPAIRRIESCLGEPLYNQSLARLCGMGIARFCQLFRETTGLSPAQFVIDRRIACAARLLVATDQSIDGIAVECGFTDRFTLTRAFTKRIGISPASFRNGHGGNRDAEVVVPFQPLVTSGGLKRMKKRSAKGRQGG